MESKHFYEFDEFRIDPEERVLIRGEQPVPLPPKAFEILMVLVHRSERVTLKDDLMKVVWPDTFVEESNLSQNIFLLRKALGEKAHEPRYIVTIPGRGYRFVAKVSEISEGVGDPASASQPQPHVIVEQPKRQHNLAWAALAALLVLGAGFAYRWHLPKQARHASITVPGAATLKPRRSVAVLGFHNLSRRPEDAWLSTAFSEMLDTELAAGEHLRMVPSEQVARVRLDLAPADVDSLSRSTLTKLRNNLGSDLVVTGSYIVMGEKPNGRVRLDVRLQDALAGEMIAEVAVAGTVNDLFDLVSQLGAQLRKKLGVEDRSTAEAASVRASLSSNPEAARFYARGLERLRLFDALTARDLLQEAVAADPIFPLSHAALASAWEALGYDSKAKEEGMRAVSLSGSLSREERLLVEGDYREITKDWATASEDYRTLFALFPDNLEYGLRLFHAHIQTANGREAQAVLDTLRKLPPPAFDDPRIDLADFDLATMQSDYRRALQAVSRAAGKAETLGARLQLAESRRDQGWTLMRLGEYPKALVNLAEAKEIFSAAGDRRHAAATLLYVADTMSDQGDYSSGLKLYREALNYDRETGCQPCAAPALNNMATVYESQRNFLEAGKLYEQALALFRKSGDRIKSATALGNVAEVHFYTGDLAGAETRYQLALDSFHEIGSNGGEASQLNGLAILHEAKGDLDGAKSRFEQALSLWRNNGQVSESTAAMLGLGEVQLAQGDLAGARKTQEEALALRQKLGEKESIAESQLDLALIFLEEGQALDAETSVREAAAEFHAENVPDLEALAYALLARALLNQGELQEARSAAKSAVSYSAMSQEPMIRISVAITAARVRHGSDPEAASRKQRASQVIHDLQALARQANTSGFLGLEFEARLAEGEVKMDSGQTTLGLAGLASLAQQAQTKGFGLIARKASAAHE